MGRALTGKALCQKQAYKSTGLSRPCTKSLANVCIDGEQVGFLL